MGNMKFRNLSTKDLDLIIQYKPDYSFPQKDITVEHIPGRNGDLVIDNDSWQNVERTYSVVSIFRPGTDFVSNSEKLIKWLTAETGYFRLEDSYDPHVYRMAAYKGNATLPNLYDEATVLNITFDCKPQRYLKNGEIEQVFDSSVAVLENPTGYTSLPDIKISGISNPEDDDVLMLSVGTTTDETTFDNVSSVITISRLPVDVTSISFISEEQTCYSNQNKSVNSSINLNNTKFPSFKSGKSMISIKKYKERSSVFESYDKKIEAKQDICYAKYLPFNDQIKMKAISTLVKSWNLLKQQVEEVYEAESYASYCMKKAVSYTFESYNNILQKNCVSYTVRPTDRSDLPDWLRLEFVENNNVNIWIESFAILGSNETSSNKGFVYINSGFIKLCETGDLIATIKDSSSLVVTIYPCMKDEDKIAVGYNELPAWLEFNPVMNDSNEIIKIEFKTKIETGKNGGFYYLPKKGIFSKAGWEKIVNTTKVLTTLTWRSINKAFMPEGLSVSKTATFTYSYLPYPYDENNTYLQYEPIKQYKVDKDGNIVLDGNGNKVEEISNDVNFRVVPSSNNDDLTLIDIEPLYTSSDVYYRTDKQELNGFVPGARFGIQNQDAKLSFIIYTIRNEFPSYKDVENWPADYINSTPVQSSGIPVGINDTQIDFKVLKRAWYKIIYTVDGDEKSTPWKLVDANSTLISSDPIVNPDDGKVAIYPTDPGWPVGFFVKDSDSITIQYIDAIENSYDFPIQQYKYKFMVEGEEKFVPDVALFKKNNELYPNNQPPEWLRIEVIKGEKEDYTDCTLSFKANTVAGHTEPLYKWDAKTTWTVKSALSDDSLTDSSRTDDTTIYYMDGKPEYSDEELGEKYTIDITQNATTGDPEEVCVKAKTSGYFKRNNSTYWSFKNIGELIGIFKKSESVIVSDLEENSALNNITITVIPRWWSL